MQTNFSPEQMASPEIADAKNILTACVHYGFCTSGCPTYVLYRDENDAPRGRIDLIHDMLEKGGKPDAKTVYHLDRCLSCLSCMTTCAVKVDYLHLSDIGRTYIEENYRRPLFDSFIRSLVAILIPNPDFFRWALKVGRIFKPFAELIGGRIGALANLVPEKSHEDILEPNLYPADGQRRFRVALLAGCAQQVLNGAISRATLRLLNRHGCDVVIPKEVGCCGALTQHMGKMVAAKAAMRPNIDALLNEANNEGLDGIIVNASGCGTTVKDYEKIFQHDPNLADPAAAISALAMDISEFMLKIGLNKPSERRGYRVAYHDACSLQHAQKIRDQPRQLLRQAGYQVNDVPEGHFCCGSAGTFNMLQPEIARDLGLRKAKNIEATNPDIVVAGNIGCMTQIDLYTGLPVLHTVELLDWATGGPKPTALKDRLLREPVLEMLEANFPTPTVSQATSQATDDDVGIW